MTKNLGFRKALDYLERKGPLVPPYLAKPAPWLRPTGAWRSSENTRTKRLKLLFGSVKRIVLQGGGHYFRATVTPSGSLLPAYYGGGTAREAQAKAQRQ